MPLAALQLGRDAEDLAHGRVDTLGPVRHDQQARLHAQPPVDELAEKRGADLPILCRRLHEAEQHLLAGDRHADRRDHRVLGEGLPVQQDRHQVIALQPAVLQFSQLAGTGADEAPRDRRGAQPKRLGDRFGAPFVLPRREAAQDLVEQARVHRPRLLELRVGLQGHFLIPQPVAHPRHRNRDLLIGEINGPGLRRPTHVPGLPALSRIPLAGQAHHFRLQRRVYLLQRHGNQSLNQRHAAVEAGRRRDRGRDEAELLSFSSNLSYVSRHGWCPPSD